MSYPRAECHKCFVPKITFWKIIGWSIVILVATFGGVVGMSTAMDSAIRTDVHANAEKTSLIDRLDERTLNMKEQLDRIEKKLQ